MPFERKTGKFYKSGYFFGFGNTSLCSTGVEKTICVFVLPVRYHDVINNTDDIEKMGELYGKMIVVLNLLRETIYVF